MKLALACTVALASLAASALGYSDKEYAAIAELPHLDLLRSEKVTISIDAPNTATNQFEIWFCTDENATRAGRDFLIGFDDGITIHGLQSASSVTTIAENPSSGNFSIRLVYRTSTLRPKPKTQISLNNAPLKESASSDFTNASPSDWQSIRIISRGIDTPTPIIQVKREKIGTLIKIVFTHQKHKAFDSLRS